MMNYFLRKIHGFDSSDWRIRRLFSEKVHTPVFVTVESHLCPYCYRFVPIRMQLYDYVKKNTNFKICRVSVDFNKAAPRFAGEGTPRIYIANSTIESALQYTGPHSYEDIKKFIQNYQNPPIIQVKSKRKLKKLLKNNYNSSIFMFHESNYSTASLNFESIANKYVNSPCLFYNLTYEKSNFTFYHYFPKLDQKIVFNSTVEKMEDFVLLHLFPTFSIATSHFLEFCRANKRKFIAISNPTNKFDKKLMKMAKSFPEDIKTAVVNCDEHYLFCQDYEINPNEENSLKLINIRKKVFYDYTGDLKEDSIKDWINFTLATGNAEKKTTSGVETIIDDVTNVDNITAYMLPAVITLLFLFLVHTLYKLWELSTIKFDI